MESGLCALCLLSILLAYLSTHHPWQLSGEPGFLYHFLTSGSEEKMAFPLSLPPGLCAAASVNQLLSTEVSGFTAGRSGRWCGKGDLVPKSEAKPWLDFPKIEEHSFAVPCRNKKKSLLLAVAVPTVMGSFSPSVPASQTASV